MAEQGRRVYIHLPYEFDAANWPQLYSAGLVLDKTPYGYHHAEAWGYRLTFSKSHEESNIVNFLRRAVGHVMGFDLWHAWRNRKRIKGAAAIWTHSEREHLAILCLRRCKFSPRDTLLIAQSIWLFGAWERLPRWKQNWYRWLIEKDKRTVLTVLSEENLKVARVLFPTMRSELLRFGTSLESFPLKAPTVTYDKRGLRPLRILAPGNDVHRDWETLVEAVRGSKSVEVRIAADLSQKQNRALKRYTGSSDRITVEHLKSLEAVHEAYAWADIVVIPLLHNKHASGITVILEAVCAGRPVIATGTGGLRGYFSDSEIYYVPPQDVEQLAVAIEECATKAGDTLVRARNAQGKLLAADLTTRGYAMRHVALTKELALT